MVFTQFPPAWPMATTLLSPPHRWEARSPLASVTGNASAWTRWLTQERQVGRDGNPATRPPHLQCGLILKAQGQLANSVPTDRSQTPERKSGHHTVNLAGPRPLCPAIRHRQCHGQHPKLSQWLWSPQMVLPENWKSLEDSPKRCLLLNKFVTEETVTIPG